MEKKRNKFTRREWNRGVPMKKTPLKKISKSHRKKLKTYYEIRNEFLATHPACAICLVLGQSPAPATETHHIRGRSGSLLCDVRGLVPSCRGHREWPHENPTKARELGVLAEASLWGVPFDRVPQNKS